MALPCSFTAHGSTFELDEISGTLKRNGTHVYPLPACQADNGKRWTKKSFDLLCRFITERRISTREAIDASVSLLRGLLGDTGKRTCISNARGICYSWEITEREIDEFPQTTSGQQCLQEEVASTVEDAPQTDIRSTETVAIVNAALLELARIAKQSCTPAQRDGVDIAVSTVLDPTSRRRGDSGQIQVPGREAGYFAKLLERIKQVERPPERIKAFIRLAVFDSAELPCKSWFQTVYEDISDAVHQGKLEIQYVFLVRDEVLTDSVRAFLSLFEPFAEKISFVSQHESRLADEMLRPSIVLLERQRIVFTHDRMDDATMIDATEWLFPSDFERFEERFRHLEVLSHCIFNRRHAHGRVLFHAGDSK